ncbi:hypothetical protein ANN_03610 [Periplaneta americana]|uniref:Uncharacterized protein n=1 Tax=Periplaneta americana TaxID=6978 RepID=A0ABQ8TZF9_PERAM|nr:hypothetical protein ANN_03610 [Periplaneta americana]
MQSYRVTLVANVMKHLSLTPARPIQRSDISDSFSFNPPQLSDVYCVSQNHEYILPHLVRCVRSSAGPFHGGLGLGLDLVPARQSSAIAVLTRQSVKLDLSSTIHDFVNKVRRTGSFWNKKHVQQRRVLTEEKFDDVGARLEHSPHKSLRRLAQEVNISKTSALLATKLLKLKPYRHIKCKPPPPPPMDLREVGYDGRDWINLAQNRDQWRAYVRAAMNLRVP